MSVVIASFSCCDDRRRDAIRDQTALNGIDRLDVLDSEAPTDAERQRILRVHFINAPAPNLITADNVRITGGDRIRNIELESVSYDGDVLVVRVVSAGDYSRYVLSLVQSPGSDQPYPGLDALLFEIAFWFKVECKSELDCRVDPSCPPEVEDPPEIDYLAKDFSSFRRVMLDRISQLSPGYTERNAADIGVTIVELLAYVGDNLSYMQDAVATEAYFATARRRVSVRRHGRLVDYLMHEGSNARVFVRFEVDSELSLAKSTQLFTRIGDMTMRIPPAPDRAYADALKANPEVFETLEEKTLWPDQNVRDFYTWGARECCLPRGATKATILGPRGSLEIGDVVIFEERIGPRTGRSEDADPSHRHAVRLTAVDPAVDPLGGLFDDPPTNTPVDVTKIEWADADALPFPLCISSLSDEEHGSVPLDRVSVVYGNVVLADHGRTIVGEAIGEVPAPHLFLPPAIGGDACAPKRRSPILPRFRPGLKEGPLTHAATVTKSAIVAGFVEQQTLDFDPDAPAHDALYWSMDQVLPRVSVNSTGPLAGAWRPRRDLLSSDEFSLHFVAELDDDARTTMRFGDGSFGVRPPEGTAFTATYRIGNGTSGNVGASAIAHFVGVSSAITRVTNPLPARGGVDRETVESARVAAPQAFRIQERAVSEGDWESATESHEGIQRARASFRWTGSWHTVFDAIDRTGGLDVDEEFEAEMESFLERWRVVGHDLEIEPPRYARLDLEMIICVSPDHFRSDVLAALLEVFNSRIAADGRRGLFHPDNFTFGEPVFASTFIAAAQAIEGVEHVELVRLERRGAPSTEVAETGKIALGPFEIAQLDNDPDFPERGVLTLQMMGGK